MADQANAVMRVLADRVIFTIGGEFTWRQIGQVLKDYHTEYSIRPSREANDAPCGLATGDVTYKIYSKFVPYTEYTSDSGTHSAHVCLHSDGVCFSGSLNVDKDWDFARELQGKVRNYRQRREHTKARKRLKETLDRLEQKS